MSRPCPAPPPTPASQRPLPLPPPPPPCSPLRTVNARPSLNPSGCVWRWGAGRTGGHVNNWSHPKSAYLLGTTLVAQPPGGRQWRLERNTTLADSRRPASCAPAACSTHPVLPTHRAGPSPPGPRGDPTRGLRAEQSGGDKSAGAHAALAAEVPHHCRHRHRAGGVASSGLSREMPPLPSVRIARHSGGCRPAVGIVICPGCVVIR